MVTTQIELIHRYYSEIANVGDGTVRDAAADQAQQSGRCRVLQRFRCYRLPVNQRRLGNHRGDPPISRRQLEHVAAGQRETPQRDPARVNAG